MLKATALSAISALMISATHAPEVGDVAPPFEAADSTGQSVSLDKLREGGRAVVLVFFPKSRTPGCTRELTQYTEQAKALSELNAELIAISGDKAPAQETFRKQLNAPFRFLPDPDGKLMKLYGTKYPLVNVSRRKTFVIDGLGRVAFIEDGSDAESLHGVANALRALKKAP